MDIKVIILLKLFNNRTKTFKQPNFSLFIVKFEKLRFTASLNCAVEKNKQKHDYRSVS